MHDIVGLFIKNFRFPTRLRRAGAAGEGFCIAELIKLRVFVSSSHRVYSAPKEFFLCLRMKIDERVPRRSALTNRTTDSCFPLDSICHTQRNYKLFPVLCFRSRPVGMHIMSVALHARRRPLHGVPRLPVLRRAHADMQNVPRVVPIVPRPRSIFMRRVRVPVAFGSIE